jgi:hypothetical protein
VQQQRASEAAAARAGRDGEVVDVADVVLPALAQRDPRQPVGIVVQQPQRRVPPLLVDLCGLPGLERARLVAGHARHRLLDERVHRPVVRAAGERADRHAGRRGRRVGEVDPHAEVGVRGPVTGLEQVCPRRLVGRRDELAHQRLAALDRARLGGLAQRRADAASLACRRHGDERGTALVEQRVPERPVAALDDPCVAREVDARRRPVRPDVLERVIGPAEVGDVAGDDQFEHSLRVAGFRGADVHPAQITLRLGVRIGARRRSIQGMVRHTRIVLATAAALAGLFSGALAPAAGDERATGSPAKVSYTEDGIPYVDSGPQCRAGDAGHKKDTHRGTVDASDY